MKKTFLQITCTILIFALASCVAACKTNGGSSCSSGHNGGGQTEEELFAPYRKPDDFSYYREMTMNPQKKLYVFNRDRSLSSAQAIIAEAIQGIYARTDCKFYYDRGGMYDFWLDDLVENYGFTTEDVTLEQMIEVFKRDYGNKYVLYDGAGNPQSLNCACTIAGALDCLPVDVTLQAFAAECGLELSVDATAMTEARCFKRYKNLLNNDAAIQLNYNDFNVQMRDYGIACRYMFFWPKDMNDPDVVRYRADILNWIKPDSPIFGWVPNDEVIDVAIASNYSLFTLASDFCTNMSVFTCKKAFGDYIYSQPQKETSLVAEKGKHYVCIMMSDGDNVQTWYNSFATNPKYLGAERGDFPMGWSVQPSLCDLAPNILRYLYDNVMPGDYYVCSVSGQGYMNPQNYPAIDSFIGGLETYLAKTDMSVVQILDSGPNKEVIGKYALIPSLKGAVYCYGMKYAGGAGSVYWANGKPFVCIKETLWNADVASMARRINGYTKDYTKIEGYTAINLHPWSMDYRDVKNLVALFDEGVVVVTADDFIRLITENVEHRDVTFPYRDYSDL